MVDLKDKKSKGFVPEKRWKMLYYVTIGFLILQIFLYYYITELYK